MMPTGYTAKLYDGKPQTFQEFVLSASRGMGALYFLRDEPADTPIPARLDPNTKHHDQAIEAAVAELTKLAAMTPEEEAAAAADDAAALQIRHATQDAEKLARKARYEAMLKAVKDWRIGEALFSLRRFMIEQLETSIQHDCDLGLSYREQPVPVEKWRAEKIKSLEWVLSYHRRERAKEIERTAERNEWLAALHAALSEPTP